MTVLYSYDYELQRDIVVDENPIVEDVVKYLKNGDVTLTEALRWCREACVPVSVFRNLLGEELFI